MLQNALAEHGLKIKWIPKKSTSKGVGGNGVALIPLGLGGVNGILETTVIQGDVPLLLPIRLLRALDVILDLQKLQMILQRHQFVLDLHEMPSGHVTVGIFDFAKGDFGVPSEAGVKSEFVLGDGEHPEAMPAQALPVQFENQAKSTTVLTTIHGGAAQTSDEVGGHQSNRGAPADVRRDIGGAESSARLAKLESHHGQSRPHSGVGRLSNYGGRMCLELDSQRLSSAGLEPEKLEDYYRMVIQSTPQLRPLKSKEPPRLAVSACIHPKNELKGGGNAQASYIVRRACHARWENPMRASEARSILKEQNKGLLGQAKATLPPRGGQVWWSRRRQPQKEMSRCFRCWSRRRWSATGHRYNKHFRPRCKQARRGSGRRSWRSKHRATRSSGSERANATWSHSSWWGRSDEQERTLRRRSWSRRRWCRWCCRRKRRWSRVKLRQE